MPTKKYDLDDFRGGMVTSPTRGSIPINSMRVMRNLRADRPRRMKKTPGPTLLYENFEGADVFRTAFRYFSPTNVPFMVAAEKALISGDTYRVVLVAKNEVSLANTTILPSLADNNVDFSDSKFPTTNEIDRVQFVQEGDALFAALPGSYLQVWYGDTATNARRSGMLMPQGTFGITAVASAGVGNLNSQNSETKYTWKVSFVSAEGVESNAGSVTGPFDADNEKYDLTIDKTGYAAGVAKKARIYRRGGFLVDDYYLVGEIDISAAGPTFTFQDNMADVDVPTVQALRNSFQSPKGADILASHSNRLWLASSVGCFDFPTAIDLIYSGLNRPETFGQGINDSLNFEGGILRCPGSESDSILALHSYGGLLCIGRTQSIYVLFGNQSNEFAFAKRSNVGIASKQAMCLAYNEMYFIGRDKVIYRLGDVEPTPISDQIQDELDAISDANFETAKMVFADKQLIITFETGSAAPNDVAYVYDFNHGGYWRQETEVYCRHIFTAKSKDTAAYSKKEDTIFVSVDGTDIYTMSTNTGTERYIWYKSPDLPIDGPGKVEATLTSLEILGTIDNGDAGDKAQIRVTGDFVTRLYDIGGTEADTGYDSSGGVIANFRPDEDTNGQFVNFDIAGKVDEISIEPMTVILSLTRLDKVGT